MDDHLHWAQLALENYRLRNPQLRFIRHSDNLTFEVTDGAKRYVLRIHKPLTVNFEDTRQQPDAIMSELMWMDALRREAHIPVPPVIAARTGSLVAAFPLPGEGRNIPCSLLGWMEGVPFEPGMEGEFEVAREVGHLMAKMHNHATAWQPPAGFTRPRYGSDHVWQIADKLAAGVGMGVIRPEDFAVINSLAGAVQAVVESIPQTRENYSLIHNDLHTGNFLIHKRKIVPIDFSLCAYGYHLFDIAISAGSLGGENIHLRREFIEGYLEQRPLPAVYVRQIEAFFITSVLGFYTFILPDPSRHEWICERLPRMLKTTGQKFLHEEPFFFEE